MESASPKMRLRLILGKYRVTKVAKDALGILFVLDLTNSVRITFDSIPPYADVREGDLLTLYTEVLTNDNPQQTPIQ